jgi:hypothetical protein
MTDAEVGKLFGVIAETVNGWTKAGCPSPPRPRSPVRRDLRLPRNWTAFHVAGLRRWLQDRKKWRQQIWKRNSASEDLVDCPSNAAIEAKHLYDLRATGQDPKDILRSIEFTAREAEVLRKSKGLGGHDFADQVRFRKDVAAEFRKLMTRDLVIAAFKGAADAQIRKNGARSPRRSGDEKSARASRRPHGCLRRNFLHLDAALRRLGGRSKRR